MRVLLRVIGAVLLCFGAIGGFIAALAIANPSFVQLANDSDPFGQSPPQFGAWVLLVLYAAISILGFFLLFRRWGK